MMIKNAADILRALPADPESRGPGRPVIYPDGCRLCNEPSRSAGLCAYHDQYAKTHDGDAEGAPERPARICHGCSGVIQLKRIVSSYGPPRKFKAITVEHRIGGPKGSICPGSGRAPKLRPQRCSKRDSSRTLRCKRVQHGIPNPGNRYSWHWNTLRYVPGVTKVWK